MDASFVLRNVSCSRTVDSVPNRLESLSTAFEPGTLNVVFGRHGCGKNLLLRLLGLMETPDEGEVIVRGESTAGWTDAQRLDLRNHHFGFVFEAPFLLPSFNVIENIAMPLFKLTGTPPEEAREHTERVLRFVGMSHCAEMYGDQLPLAAQLRISLARALVTRPAALFVENLDRVLTDDDLIDFLRLLGTARGADGCCVLVTAASGDLSSFGTRALEMSEGRVVRDWQPKGLFS